MDGRVRRRFPAPIDPATRGKSPAAYWLLTGKSSAWPGHRQPPAPPPLGAPLRPTLRAVCTVYTAQAPHSSYRLRSVPTPSMVTSTMLPGFMEPTPTEVPQQMTSPACSVMSCEIALTMQSGGKKRSVTG